MAADSKAPLLASELVLNDDGSVYHLHLKNEHIADRVILVGDPGRVQRVSDHFDAIDHKIGNREFLCHTGTFKGTPITVLSTGIGTDNIDIVLNELDAAVNIDPNTRKVKDRLRRLSILRLGTSGALQEDIPVDSVVVSLWGLALDALMHYYKRPADAEADALQKMLKQHLNSPEGSPAPLIFKANPQLCAHIGKGLRQGITATAPGFYAPQGRTLRLPCAWEEMHKDLYTFRYRALSITNFEMESSALYGLGAMLGHRCCTACVIIANRRTMQFSADHHKAIDSLIGQMLPRLAGFTGD